MRKFISLLLVCIFIISITHIGSAEMRIAENNNNKNFVNKTDGDFQLNLAQKRVIQSDTNGKITLESDKENNRIEILLKAKNSINYGEYNFYDAKGEIILDGKSYQFQTDGAIHVANLSNGSVFYEGNLYGNLFDKNKIPVDELILSFQYSQNSNEALVSATIGVYTEEGQKPIVIDFGSISKEDNNLYFEDKARKIKEKKQQNENNFEGDFIDEIHSNLEIASLSDDDILQATKSWYSIVGRLMYLAMYHADSTVKGASNLFQLRIWTDTNKVEQYYDYYSAEDEWVKFGTCTFNDIYYYIQNDDYWDSHNNPYPENQKKTAKFYLPVWLGSTLGVYTFEKELTLSSVTFTRSGSPYSDRTRWDLYKFGGFNANDTNALSTTPWSDMNDKGLSGRVSFYYTRTDSKTTNVTGYARIYYYLLTEQTDGNIYVRNVTIYDNTSSTIRVN